MKHPALADPFAPRRCRACCLVWSNALNVTAHCSKSRDTKHRLAPVRLAWFVVIGSNAYVRIACSRTLAFEQCGGGRPDDIDDALVRIRLADAIDCAHGRPAAAYYVRDLEDA